MVSNDNLVLAGISSDSLADPLHQSRTLDEVRKNWGRRLIGCSTQIDLPLLVHRHASETEDDGNSDSLCGCVASRKLEPKIEGPGHVFGANRGPRSSADGLAFSTKMKTFWVIKYLNVHSTNK